MTRKQPKILYLLENSLKSTAPKCFYSKAEKLIAKYSTLFNSEYIDQRVNYYCKLNEVTKLSSDCVCDKNFNYAKPSAYFLDLKPYLKHFKGNKYLEYVFGDVIHVPSSPSIVKSRPITNTNQNSVLFNLDKRRHFVFINDVLSYEDKKDLLIWRGNVFPQQELRQAFLNRHFNNPRCNAGHVNDFEDNKYKTTLLSMEEHLQYKFILSIEGNDVATNLKWIMTSNSLCFSTKPRYETWMMEGALIPNHHYVLLKDDYSDLDEKMSYYLANPEEAKQIIRNANAYVDQFKNPKREYLVSLLVLQKYFNMTNEG
ncbi:MAG: glycosyl transferase family 90 [Mangrovibacterium sp.]